MNYLVATLAVLLAAAPVHALGNWDARLGGVSGDVTVFAADGSPEVSGEEDMPLEEGDRIVVGAGGSAEVALDGESLIVVREKSDFKLERTAKDESSFFLSVGAILAKIQKLTNQRLSVRTPTAVAAVRGTEFGVIVKGDDSHVGVFDSGKVEVASAADGKPEVLISNQETTVKKGQAPQHAAQLRRFKAYRAQVRGQGRRLAAIKARWKALPPEQRLEKRRKAIERMREHRKKFLEKRADVKQKLTEKQKQAVERRQRNRAEDLRKMDERRKKIRRNKR